MTRAEEGMLALHHKVMLALHHKVMLALYHAGRLAPDVLLKSCILPMRWNKLAMSSDRPWPRCQWPSRIAMRCPCPSEVGLFTREGA